MYAFLSLIGLLAVVIGRESVTADEQCFSFKGDSYLIFTPSNFTNANSVHYELTFRTDALNGVLMYARGSHGDSEALYIRGGKLNYHLFNTESTGIGRQFGGHFVSEERVDTNVMVTVHVYRSWPLPVVPILRQTRNKTGIEFELNGSLRSYVDNARRDNIDISSTVYFGGYSQPLSDTVPNFTGEIMGIKEHKNSYTFENPSLNYKSLVDLQCVD